MHSELDDLKRTKVTLMQKLRDESKRTQAAEQRHVREMHQLRKEKRQAEGQVRSLQERAKQTEQVLRRKQEEVQSLRRRPTRLVSAGTPSTSNSSATAAAASATNSATASGPAGLAATRRRAAAAAASTAGQQHQLSARAMKGRWDSIERALSTTVGRRQTVGHLAADMENWVHEREKLARRLDQLNAKRARFERAGQTAGPDWDQLLEQMRNARSQAELAQDNIAECQRSIIELEEQRLPESSALFGRLTSLQEARYLLERLYQLALDRGLSALQRETELRDARANAEAKAKETEQALEMLQIALKQAPVPGLDADDLFFGVVGGGDGEDGDVDGEAAGGGGGGAAAAADDDNEDADSLENGEAGGGGSSSKPAVAPRQQQQQQQQQQQMFNLGGAATIDSRPRQIRKFHLEMLNSKRKTATAEELLGLKSAVDMSRSMDEGALAGGALRNNSSESALLPVAGARVPGNASSSAARPKSFRLPVAAAAAAAPPSALQPTTPSSGGGRPLKFPAAAAAAPPTSGPAAQRVQQQLLLQQQQQQLLMSRPASKDGMTTSFYIPRQHADIPEVDNASADAESIAVLQQSSASAASAAAAAAASGVDQNFRRSGSLRSRDAAGQPASMGNVFNRLTSGSVRSSPNIESSKG
ncbi:hypothetical protein BOX15_Mlig027393g1 [Macrostomum lignano]|uniref:KIF21A/B second helical domain-containing protein n=1 Tax=Macrostomum lignano TaxID=282301 RepID=A0A267FWU0_9PLAT|nr:hypothetical protein BOX15_Mlig027393g1 [Macrostomum lignano]